MWIFHPHFFHSLFSLVSSSRGRFGASRRSSSAVLHCCSWCAVWRKFQSLPDGQTAQNPFCRPPNLKCEVLSARKNRVKMTNIKKMASEAKCTIVVIGDSRTGKSVLLHRFVHKTFQPVSKKSNWHLPFFPIINSWFLVTSDYMGKSSQSSWLMFTLSDSSGYVRNYALFMWSSSR